jgi:hypothetical protein
MKKINKFLSEANLFKVWLTLYPIMGLFVSFLVYGLDGIIGENTFGETIKYFYFGALFSIPFTTLIILTISMGRKTEIFWNYAKYLEELVNNVKTKEELEHIWYNEYNELIDKCQGGVQIGEVKRIRAIIETRLKYWK